MLTSETGSSGGSEGSAIPDTGMIELMTGVRETSVADAEGCEDGDRPVATGVDSDERAALTAGYFGALGDIAVCRSRLRLRQSVDAVWSRIANSG